MTITANDNIESTKTVSLELKETVTFEVVVPIDATEDELKDLGQPRVAKDPDELMYQHNGGDD